jgi:hypothetical protein
MTQQNPSPSQLSPTYPKNEPFLWVHLVLLCAVPLTLVLSMGGLAVGEPVFPSWFEMMLLGLPPVFFVTWLQWQQPLSPFSLWLVAKPDRQLSDNQRRVLALLKQHPNGWHTGGWVAVIASAFLYVIFRQMYEAAPLAESLAPFPPFLRLFGILWAEVFFLASNLFWQSGIAAIRVLLTSPTEFDRLAPYASEKIKNDFTTLGLQIFPVQMSAERIDSPESLQSATDLVTPIQFSDSQASNLQTAENRAIQIPEMQLEVATDLDTYKEPLLESQQLGSEPSFKRELENDEVKTSRATDKTKQMPEQLTDLSEYLEPVLESQLISPELLDAEELEDSQETEIPEAISREPEEELEDAEEEASIEEAEISETEAIAHELLDEDPEEEVPDTLLQITTQAQESLEENLDKELTNSEAGILEVVNRELLDEELNEELNRELTDSEEEEIPKAFSEEPLDEDLDKELERSDEEISEAIAQEFPDEELNEELDDPEADITEAIPSGMRTAVDTTQIPETLLQNAPEAQEPIDEELDRELSRPEEEEIPETVSREPIDEELEDSDKEEILEAISEELIDEDPDEELESSDEEISEAIAQKLLDEELNEEIEEEPDEELTNFEAEEIPDTVSQEPIGEKLEDSFKEAEISGTEAIAQELLDQVLEEKIPDTLLQNVSQAQESLEENLDEELTDPEEEILEVVNREPLDEELEDSLEEKVTKVTEVPEAEAIAQELPDEELNEELEEKPDEELTDSEEEEMPETASRETIDEELEDSEEEGIYETIIDEEPEEELEETEAFSEEFLDEEQEFPDEVLEIPETEVFSEEFIDEGFNETETDEIIRNSDEPAKTTKGLMSESERIDIIQSALDESEIMKTLFQNLDRLIENRFSNRTNAGKENTQGNPSAKKSEEKVKPKDDEDK